VHLLLRPDSRETAGTGHLARCHALAQAWVDAGGVVTLAAEHVPPAWVDRYQEEGVTVAAGAEDEEAEWVVLDGYCFSTDDQRKVKESGRRLLVIDDHGQAGEYVADVVLDQNLGAAEATYCRRDASTDLLLGPRHALLRREFRRRADWTSIVPANAERLLVALGGSPVAAVTALFDGVLSHPALRSMEVTRLTGRTDVARAMAESDLALSAAGSTCWELCCMGLPAVLVPVATNQIPLAEALAAVGAAENGGPAANALPEDIAASVARLAGDAARREAMAASGRRVVDGRGARRVAARLRAELISVRPVTDADCRLLWEWTNDPATRAASFSSAPVGWDEHTRWFARRMADPTARHFIMATPDGLPLGQVRFDLDGDRAVIGTSVDARRRGRGWGPAIIIGGIRGLTAETAVRRVVAQIKSANGASRTAFEDAGFSLEREEGGTATYIRDISGHGEMDR
jgi:UDP-2,4-diacetamido-2,4,6-trideoxy-beta-L-altropyranose hydrolase